jgi:hypothetical protein
VNPQRQLGIFARVIRHPFSEELAERTCVSSIRLPNGVWQILKQQSPAEGLAAMRYLFR